MTRPREGEGGGSEIHRRPWHSLSKTARACAASFPVVLDCARGLDGPHGPVGPHGRGRVCRLPAGAACVGVFAAGLPVAAALHGGVAVGGCLRDGFEGRVDWIRGRGGAVVDIAEHVRWCRVAPVCRRLLCTGGGKGVGLDGWTVGVWCNVGVMLGSR